MNSPTPDPVFDGERLKALRLQRGLTAEEAVRLALDTTVEYLLGVTSDGCSIHELTAARATSASG